MPFVCWFAAVAVAVSAAATATAASKKNKRLFTAVLLCTVYLHFWCCGCESEKRFAKGANQPSRKYVLQYIRFFVLLFKRFLAFFSFSIVYPFIIGAHTSR